MLGIDLKEWNEVEPIEQGEFESLSLGGHEVKIINAGLYTSEQSGITSLKVIVDIAGKDKQAGYFQRQYDSNNLSEKKWPSGGTRYLSLKKENLAYTKGFITSVEKSNKGFVFDTNKDWKQLIGLKVAGVFGLEEYERQDHTIGTITKLTGFRSLEKLDEIKIPTVRLLDGSRVDYEDYSKRKNNNSNSFDGVVISPNDLPF